MKGLTHDTHDACWIVSSRADFTLETRSKTYMIQMRFSTFGFVFGFTGACHSSNSGFSETLTLGKGVGLHVCARLVLLVPLPFEI